MCNLAFESREATIPAPKASAATPKPPKPAATAASATVGVPSAPPSLEPISCSLATGALLAASPVGLACGAR